jgi:hypothetical protein
MDLSRLRRGEIAAAIGGLVLVISMFLPAYSPNSGNAQAVVAGGHGDASIWQANTTLRWFLLITAIAPIVLVYIVAANQQLAWPRGELTAVIGLIAVALLIFSGVIDRPGTPSGQIGLTVGWFIALLAALAVLAGGAIRSAETGRQRKPPGTF